MTNNTRMFHSSTYQYLKPTEGQMDTMAEVRNRIDQLSTFLDLTLPQGPDKTYLLRKLREVGMWANVCITREADGRPRAEPYSTN